MLVTALALAAASPPLSGQWAQFGREGALSGVRETVEIATIAGAGPVQHRLRYTRSSPGYANAVPRGVTVAWTDTVACPAARAVVTGMRALAPPRIAPVGVAGERPMIVLDGTTYWLDAPSSDPAGRIAIRSNVRSALAQWVDGALAPLTSCWAVPMPGRPAQ